MYTYASLRASKYEIMPSEPVSFLGSLFGDPFNIFIFILAAANVVFMILAFRSTQQLKQALFRGSSVLDRFLHEKAGIKDVAVQTIRSEFAGWELLYKNATRWFHIFSSMIAIFPLMGISGTVIGIIPALSDFDNINTYFSLALSSTLLGIMFSVVFKVFEGMLAGDYTLVSERIGIITSDITKLVLEKEKEV